MHAFTDANNAAVRAAKDIRDLIDGRDETDLWDEAEEIALDDLMVTLTIKRRKRDEMWEKLITQHPSRYNNDEFLLAIDADIMMNKASHVAKRSIIIIRLQSIKEHGKRVVK